ncbi:heterogeneous nuclear ribonucleoproteins A2/B1 [Ditylenchus destructor]|uniref:Heterogeneous nuclear ribonucleoproteins A2/B1 n=1 Tax=Ditylenchus destructor TaxID=166010 RepID=A0AAD4NKC1_9BILA|nr:heterogeneous nuclear ribonucleoproteins A2/B1 [Ditylenchus destructor]
MDRSIATLRCILCGPTSHTYTSREHLEIHVSSHFSYTPYECGDCVNASLPYKYPTEYAIIQHYKQAHPNMPRFKICKYSSPETREVGTEVFKAVQQSIALLTITKPYILPSVASTENSVRNEQFAQSAVMDYIPMKKPKIEDEVEVIDLCDDDPNVMEVPEDLKTTVVTNASESVTRGETKQDPRDKVKIKEYSNSAAIDRPVQLSTNSVKSQQQSEQMSRVKNENFESFQDYCEISQNCRKTRFPEIQRSTAQVLHVPEVNSSENSAIAAPSSDILQDPRLKRKHIAVSTTLNNQLNLYPNKESYEKAFQNINQNHPTVEETNPESSSTWKQEIRHKLRNVIQEEYAQAGANVILAPLSSKHREPESRKERRHHSRKEVREVISRYTSHSPERSHHKKARVMLEEKEKYEAPEVLEREDLRKLFVRSLSLKTTVESLRKFYSQFGKICDCFVKKINHETYMRRSWGHVTFSKMKEVDNAIMNQPHIIDGIKVKAVRYRRNSGHIPSFELLIEGIRKFPTEKEIKKYFRGFGEVHHVDMIPSRRAAVITFKSADPVDKCALLEEHSIAGHRCIATRNL